MANSDAMPAEFAAIVCREMHAMRQPCARREPAHFFKQFDGAALIHLRAIGIFIFRFSQMRMKPRIELFNERRTFAHQALGHRERRTRRQRHADERAFAFIVIAGEQTFAIG